VAQENKDILPEPADENDSSGSSGDEFENTVTIALTGVMERAFDHGFETENDLDVEIVDAELVVEPADSDDLLEPGFVLNDRFEIVTVVHTGGMSSVYKAIDRRRNVEGSGQVHVAIKMMRQSVASEREARLALEREAARVQRLSHPNIVNVFDFDEHDGRFFMVMEWLEGETVLALLKRASGQQLDRAFAWRIIEATAAGVQHAHLNNVVHADINPANIFITVTHEIKLLDFGVARHCGGGAAGEQRLLWATKAYASPEVLAGRAPVAEDDVFSLGCVAYRLLNGTVPFGKSHAAEAKRDKLEVAPVPGLPEEEWQIIRRSLDYERANRPMSTAVFFPATRQQKIGAPADDESSGQGGRWLASTAVVLAFLAAGFWWLNESRNAEPVTTGALPVQTESNEATAPPEVTTEEATALDSDVTAEEPTVVPSPTEALLDRAALAIANGQYVQPEGASARDLYRSVLDIDDAEPNALRGLRSISDTYVQEAEAALRAGNPAASYAALAVAANTDSANPAIEIIDYLLVAEGNQQLASARTAALSGDLEGATAALERAGQFRHIEPAAIAEVNALIDERANEEVLLAQIAVVDERIADGFLLSPEGDSARDIVLALATEHAGNPLLGSATNQLGERLLADAALATSAGEYAEAGRLLAGVESLGILEPELIDARAALDAAQKPPEPEPEPVLPAAAAAVGAAAIAASSPGENGMAPAQPVAASTDAVLAPVAEAAPVEAAPRRRSLTDLGIERYVSPKYPRAAERRRLSGFVEVAFTVNPDGSTGDFSVVNAVPNDVFNASARKAVRQWSFEPRDEPITARIVLSFEAPPQ
jgi:TonB family protein